VEISFVSAQDLLLDHRSLGDCWRVAVWANRHSHHCQVGPVHYYSFS